nr:hypothetical protein [Tanacetum cinerariifolium]
MSTQQDIYIAGSESRPLMLNKENYVPWSSRLLRYAKSRRNGKLIHNSILNGPYVRKIFPKPGEEGQVVQRIGKPEWSRHGTIVHQTKDLHTADYTQLYDFLKYNQKEVDELKAERIAKTHDPLALMSNSNNPYVFLAPHQDQPSFNQNYLQQPMPTPEDITDPTTAMNMALALMAKAFKLNYSTPTNNNQRISSNPRNMQIAQPGYSECYLESKGSECWKSEWFNWCSREWKSESDWEWVQNVGNQNGLIGVQGNGNQNQIGNGHYARNCTVKPRTRDLAHLQTQLLIVQKEEVGIQLQAKEYDLMAAAADLDEIKEVNANYILMANLQQASTRGTQTNSAPVYDINGSTEVHENCDDNEIFNMFTQEEQYTELLEPIPKSHQVPQNNNDVISEDTSVEQDLSDDTTPSVARKFLDEVKGTIVTLQRVVKQRMTIETHNWASSAHQELHKIVRDEIFPIVNQVDARLQNFEIQFLKDAAKFVREFKSLANEADASLAKHKALELEFERLLKAVNDWYKKCDDCKYDKILYDKAYKDMQQKIERLQAQLGDIKGKSKDTSCVSDTRNPLSQKLENENVELEFQVLNYARENAHLKAIYKNLF